MNDIRNDYNIRGLWRIVYETLRDELFIPVKMPNYIFITYVEEKPMFENKPCVGFCYSYHVCRPYRPEWYCSDIFVYENRSWFDNGWTLIHELCHAVLYDLDINTEKFVNYIVKQLRKRVCHGDFLTYAGCGPLHEKGKWTVRDFKDKQFYLEQMILNMWDD